MSGHQAFHHYCAALIEAEPEKAPLVQVLSAIADAAIAISERVSHGLLEGRMDEATGTNSDGDVQKALDLFCDQALQAALASAPVAHYASEESEDIVTLDPDAPLSVAVDPLDGSNNIDTNLTIGTIFSVVPSGPVGPAGLGPFGGPGTRQRAAGFAVYGPQTSLVLSHGQGVDIFTLDRRDSVFRLVKSNLRMPEGVREYAINASNYRHWDDPVRTYVDDCIQGSSGVRGTDFNMRWLGCLVADAVRILNRGGIYLYPSDQRTAYRNGRLRLVYEGHPMAFLVEQAGGKASTGRERVLDVCATTLHQRVPLIFGSRDKVERVEGLYRSPVTGNEASPLFARRGLFRS
ncbi:MAG: class 1 fructose-bisphosphatase [Alsobacter sp.]